MLGWKCGTIGQSVYGPASVSRTSSFRLSLRPTDVNITNKYALDSFGVIHGLDKIFWVCMVSVCSQAGKAN